MSSIECRNCKYIWTMEESKHIILGAIKAVRDGKVVTCAVCSDELHLVVGQDEEHLLHND